MLAWIFRLPRRRLPWRKTWLSYSTSGGTRCAVICLASLWLLRIRKTSFKKHSWPCSSTLRGWLFRVAHNLALKRYQQSRQDSKNIHESTVASESTFIDPAPNPEDQFAISQTQKRLMAVLEGLPEQNRRCLYLRAEGLRYREIAEILDMSLGAVSLCLERSLAHIARVIER
jgi:RNA polymerase sigma factor (sigma-70 family)